AGILERKMKASVVAILPVVAGCHLASGIDEMKIDRRVAEVPKEKFACEAFADDFEELDASQWQEVDSGEGVELVHDADITGVIVDLDDAGAGARGGILAGTKVDFNAC